jgi:hypothetical protein
LPVINAGDAREDDGFSAPAAAHAMSAGLHRPESRSIGTGTEWSTRATGVVILCGVTAEPGWPPISAAAAPAAAKAPTVIVDANICIC